MFKWFNRLLIVALLAIATPLTIVAGARLLGHSTLIVSGKSMGDAIPLGSLAVTRAVRRSKVRVKDVILVEEKGKTPYIHRITAFAEGSSTQVITKGDANQEIDPQPYAMAPKTQVVWFHFRWLGFLMSFVASKQMIIAMAVLMPLIAAWMAKDLFWGAKEESPA